MKAFMYAIAFTAASWAGALGFSAVFGGYNATTVCVGLLGTAFWFLAGAGTIKEKSDD